VVRALCCKYSGFEFESGSYLALNLFHWAVPTGPYVPGVTSPALKTTVEAETIITRIINIITFTSEGYFRYLIIARIIFETMLHQIKQEFNLSLNMEFRSHRTVIMKYLLIYIYIYIYNTNNTHTGSILFLMMTAKCFLVMSLHKTCLHSAMGRP